MRYLCDISYDGSHFYGFQRQRGFQTVQGTIEAALNRIYGRKIDIHSCSRTDTGVHALQLYFHYDVDIKIPIEKLSYVLDSQLPEEISVSNILVVPDSFHARYNTIDKTYRYDILLSKNKQIFKSRYALIYKKNFDLEKIRQLSKIFLGKRNCAALMAAGSYKENTVREIKNIDIKENSDGLVSIYICADGFLYHMVRIIIGAFLDYNEDKRSLNEFVEGLEKADRNVFRRTAPACGLYLKEIRLEQF